MDVIVPAVLTTANAEAVVPIPGELIVTTGEDVYPDPPSVTVIMPIINDGSVMYLSDHVSFNIK